MLILNGNQRPLQGQHVRINGIGTALSEAVELRMYIVQTHIQWIEFRREF